MGLLVMDSFNFCLSENASISLSLLKGIFTGNKFLGWQNTEGIPLYFIFCGLLLRSQMEVCYSCKDNLSFSLWLLLRFSNCLWFFIVSLCRASFLYLSYLVFITLVSVTCVSLILGSVSNIVCVQFFSFLSFRDFWLNKYMSEIFTLSSLFSYSFIFFIFFCLIYILEIPSNPSLSSPTFSSAVSKSAVCWILDFNCFIFWFYKFDLVLFDICWVIFYKQKFSSLFYISSNIANIAAV